MASTKLKTARANRDLAVARIKDIYKSAKDVESDSSLMIAFSVRLTTLDAQYKTFDKHHTSILELASSTDTPTEGDELVRAEIDECYYEILRVQAKLVGSQTQVVSTNVNNANTSPNVKLPVISIPTFNGDVKCWQSFIDLFNSLIHNNGTLTEVEKFQYLKSNLSAEPLSIISNIPLTNDNYKIAYDALFTRYQNKRLLATNAWQNINELKKLSMDNADQLRHLLDVFCENLKILKYLGFPVEHWDFLVFNILLSKLDSSTLKRFEFEFSSVELPTFEQLTNFLLKQCVALDSVAFTSSSPLNGSSGTYQGKKKSSNPFNSKASLVGNKMNLTCPMCQAEHLLHGCSRFKEKSPRERFNFAKKKNLCINCLKANHSSSSCPSVMRCKVCQNNHHTLLHFVPSKKTENDSSLSQTHFQAPQSQSSADDQVLISNKLLSLDHTVLLSTVQVNIVDNINKVQTVRGLLDSGSQANFLTEKCANRLGLRRRKSHTSVCGLGQQSYRVLGEVTCTLRPRGCQEPEVNVDFLILPSICSKMPLTSFSLDNWSHISNLTLADPHLNVPSDVEMLLGADVFPTVLKEGRLEGQPGQPIALNTIFGWIIMGKLSSSKSAVNSLFISLDSNLDETIKKFWEIEEVPSVSTTLSSDDIACENIFLSTTTRDVEGRYIVNLPFKEKEPCFHPDIRTFALRRFLALERRLITDPNTYNAYTAFMQDYLECNHMSLAEDVIPTPFCYYIPHHCVQKPDSLTTKLRVVFDASFSPLGSGSLNDTLFVGQKLQKDIVNILLRFRLHKIVFTADIKQMYRQIWVNPSQRNYQKILWRFSPREPVRDYLLNTVTFGVTSSPFLALRVVQQLANDEGSRFPLACEILRNDMFVDDCVSGAATLEEALNIQSQLIQIFKLAGFELRKWSSNEKSLISHLPESMLGTQPSCFDLDLKASVKILGLQWCPSLDAFSYQVEPLNRPCTKRNLLSEVARIYDPLGFLAPLTFFVKFLVQHLWSLGLDWDDFPPDNVVNKWNQLRSEFSLLKNLRVPRWVLSENVSSLSLHGFCDASERGYACAVYLRIGALCMDTDDCFKCFLVCAKTKVAPLKKISIPRLELSAAVLLSELLEFVIKTYQGKVQFSDIFAWSDSMVALNWIKSPPYRWKTFVSNRVSHIQNLVTPSHWRHVPSEHNPADHASRGLLPSNLLDCSQWWAGPTWLSQPEDFWPKSSLLPEPACLEEEKSPLSLLGVTDSTFVNLLLDKYSSLEKIQRIVCYCLRFVYNCRSKTDKETGHFTSIDYQKAMVVLAKHVQEQVFSDEIKRIKTGEPISKPLRKLAPFLDSENILRVGGRLAHSSLSYGQIHPILLPRKTRLTELIIEFFHKKNLHPGTQNLHYLICQQFWILSPKRAIRSVISKCIRCFRTKPKFHNPPMGNLPSYRLNEVKPFATSGVDMAGPFLITMAKTRGSKSRKAYLCLFICMATKALHLELVSELSTEAFLAALRRFIARRGRCNHLVSDQGTNFIGANRELQNIVKTSLAQEAIKWSFNPPGAPHFGGIWEANIKSVKTHLNRVVGEQILTFEELYTVLVQIESVLNSRPLCPISSDPNDLQALTPGHFLVQEPLTSPPCHDFSDIKMNRLNRWQLIQRMLNDFWKRWSFEYLTTLQQRTKWCKDSSNLNLNQLVLIKDEQVPPLRWRLARVIKLHPGSDGVCRVATVKTSSGVLQRPIVKLSPLPIN